MCGVLKSSGENCYNQATIIYLLSWALAYEIQICTTELSTSIPLACSHAASLLLLPVPMCFDMFSYKINVIYIWACSWLFHYWCCSSFFFLFCFFFLCFGVIEFCSSFLLIAILLCLYYIHFLFVFSDNCVTEYPVWPFDKHMGIQSRPSSRIL